MKNTLPVFKYWVVTAINGAGLFLRHRKRTNNEILPFLIIDSQGKEDFCNGMLSEGTEAGVAGAE